MSDETNILSLREASVGYNKPVLQNLSLDFKGGTVTGIIGNNGKGKTTLLKTLCGLQPLLKGRVLYNNRDINSFDAHHRSMVFGMTFSSSYVSFPVSVFELVAMGRYPHLNHWASLGDNDERMVIDALTLCGINSLAHKTVTDLSDGERQKVFIAKLIAQQAPVMLLDEPTAFLDYGSKKEFFHWMKQLAAGGACVLISSHDVEFLSNCADNLLMIEEDETVVHGTAEEVKTTAYFRRHFTGV